MFDAEHKFKVSVSSATVGSDRVTVVRSPVWGIWQCFLRRCLDELQAYRRLASLTPALSTGERILQVHTTHTQCSLRQTHRRSVTSREATWLVTTSDRRFRDRQWTERCRR